MDKALYIIAKMMTDENNELSTIQSQIEEKVGPDSAEKLLKDIKIIYNTRIKLLENIYSKLKNLK